MILVGDSLTVQQTAFRLSKALAWGTIQSGREQGSLLPQHSVSGDLRTSPFHQGLLL